MKKSFSVILSLITVFTIGCGSSNDLNQVSGQQGNVGVNPAPTPSPTGTASPSPSPSPTITPTPTVQAHLRVVNPNANLDNVSVSIDGTVVDADLDRLESTLYLELEPGTHTVSVSGTDLSESTTVNLAANSYSSTVYASETLILSQAIEDRDALVTITDDVTPVQGQLNARLFSALTVDSTSSFFDDNDTLLLGPVDELTATAYETFAASAAASEFFVAEVELATGGTFDGIFIDELDSSDSFVEALVQEVGTTGANVSIFLSMSGNNRLYVLALVDEAGDGSRAIRSEENRTIEAQ